MGTYRCNVLGLAGLLWPKVELPHIKKCDPLGAVYNGAWGGDTVGSSAEQSRAGRAATADQNSFLHVKIRPARAL